MKNNLSKLILLSLFVCFVIIISLSFCTNVRADSQFMKYDRNPVIKVDQNIQWKSARVSNPFVLFDDGIFKMWYAAHNGTNWNIAYATSTDGYTWIDYSNNPIMSPSYDGIENHVNTPKVLKDSPDHYFLYYTASTNDIDYFEIRIAESNDGIHWVKLPNKLTIDQSWERTGLANGMVLKDEQSYHLWYDARDSTSAWRKGYATSNDGINWVKYESNPISLYEGNEAGAFFVLKDNNKLLGWGHGGNNGPKYIFQTESNNYISWENNNRVLESDIISGDFDKYLVASPSVLKYNNKLYMYYAGFNGSTWQIGLATKDLGPVEATPTPTLISTPTSKTTPTPTPTFTPTPTSTLTPTPTPTPDKNIVIMIPGLMGSWNKDAIIHNQPVNITDWKINPVAKEYDGFTKTFTNLGYKQNQDYYIFAYDWRKGINNLADDLNAYINQQVFSAYPNAKIDLVGHSLGGLVARTYFQKYKPSFIDKTITVGSPHKGTTQVYPVVEAGEIERNNDLLWLGQKIILQLYKDGIKTDKQVVAEKLPVAKDLLPTFDFLVNKNNAPISVANMHIKNDILAGYNSSAQGIFSSLYTIAGEKGNTIARYKVTDRNILDQLLDNYVDGRPVDKQYQMGDFTVLKDSAQLGNFTDILALNHGELIYKKDGIKKILDVLDVPYQESNIAEGGATNINPSMIFLLMSPAQMQVRLNSQVFQEKDGLILIENAQPGNYDLEVEGTDKGRYSVVVGEITNNYDKWDKIEGEITSGIPSSQTDHYLIEFSQNNLTGNNAIITNPEILLKELGVYLSNLNKDLNNRKLNGIITEVNKAEKYYQKKQLALLKLSLISIHSQLFELRRSISDTDAKVKILYAVEKLETLYGQSLKNYSGGLVSMLLKNSLSAINKSYSLLEKLVLSQKNKGKDVSQETLVLLAIKKRVGWINGAFYQNDYNLADILLKTCLELLKEIGK